MLSEIEVWVKSKLDNGYTKQQIIDYMLQNGYTQEQSMEIFSRIQPSQPQTIQKSQDKSKDNHISLKTVILLMILILLLGTIAFGILAETRSGLISGLFS